MRSEGRERARIITLGPLVKSSGSSLSVSRRLERVATGKNRPTTVHSYGLRSGRHGEKRVKRVKVSHWQEGVKATCKSLFFSLSHFGELDLDLFCWSSVKRHKTTGDVPFSLLSFPCHLWRHCTLFIILKRKDLPLTQIEVCTLCFADSTRTQSLKKKTKSRSSEVSMSFFL